MPLIIPVAVICLLLFAANRLFLNILVYLLWLPQGKDVLLVHSNSPIWSEHMTQEIMPLVIHRAEVLNWSERKQWSRWSLAVRLFHSYSGSRDYNPMVILFKPFTKARFFRFLPAFDEWKHGNPGPVERLRQDLAANL
jgi:hypothetical protein